MKVLPSVEKRFASKRIASLHLGSLQTKMDRASRFISIYRRNHSIQASTLNRNKVRFLASGVKINLRRKFSHHLKSSLSETAIISRTAAKYSYF